MDHYIGHGFLRASHDHQQTRIVTLRGNSRTAIERRARRLLKLTTWRGYCLALYPLSQEQQLDTEHATLYSVEQGNWRAI